jgi:hypothetical protein
MYLKNNYTTKGDLTEIKIKCDSEEFVALIDTDDLPKAKAFKGTWYGFKSGNTTYVLIVNRKESLRLHRVIMGPQANQLVDHKNRDGLDNRKLNLRLCSRGENNQNKNLAKNNKSGYRGVSLHKPTGKWIARLSVDRKSKHLGYFNTPEEANEVVLEAREVLMPFNNEFPSKLENDTYDIN